MMGPTARRAAVWRRELAIFLIIILSGVLTNSAPAADPARGAELLHRAGLYAGPIPVNFIVIAQVGQPKAPAKKDSWLRRAWRSQAENVVLCRRGRHSAGGGGWRLVFGGG